MDHPGGGSVETMLLWGIPPMWTSDEAKTWFHALGGHAWAENLPERVFEGIIRVSLIITPDTYIYTIRHPFTSPLSNYKVYISFSKYIDFVMHLYIYA